MAPWLVRRPMSRPACSVPAAVMSPEDEVEPSNKMSSPVVTPWTPIAPPACKRTSELGPLAVAWAPRVIVPPAITSTSPPPSAKEVPDTVIGPLSLASIRLSATPDPSGPPPEVSAPVLTVVAARMAMSSLAVAEVVSTPPVRARRAMSRPA